MRIWFGLLGMVAGLLGAAGVALAAAGAHLAGGATLTTAAQFCLFHATALVALQGLGLSSTRPAPIKAAATLLAIGTILFAGDLAWRGLLGAPPVRFVAPLGGLVLIAGWLSAGVALWRAPLFHRRAIDDA